MASESSGFAIASLPVFVVEELVGGFVGAHVTLVCWRETRVSESRCDADVVALLCSP